MKAYVHARCGTVATMEDGCCRNPDR